MKKIILFSVLMANVHFAMAQMEIKTNPIAIIFEALPISLEYIANDSWGLELDGFVASGAGWLYFPGNITSAPRWVLIDLTLAPSSEALVEMEILDLALAFLPATKPYPQKMCYSRLHLDSGEILRMT